MFKKNYPIYIQCYILQHPIILVMKTRGRLVNQKKSTRASASRRNNFYKDAGKILKIVSKNIADNKLANDWEVIENTLFFAIAIEKLLKSILFDINHPVCFRTARL